MAFEEREVVKKCDVLARVLFDDNDPYFKCKSDSKKIEKLPKSIRAHFALRKKQSGHPKENDNLATYYEGVLKILLEGKEHQLERQENIVKFARYHSECILGKSGEHVEWDDTNGIICNFGFQACLNPPLTSWVWRGISAEDLSQKIDTFVNDKLQQPALTNSAGHEGKRKKNWMQRLIAIVSQKKNNLSTNSQMEYPRSG